MDNSSQKRSESRREYCAVKCCGNTAKNNPNLSFHHVPKAKKGHVPVKNSFGIVEQIDKRKAWLQALKVTDVPQRMTVCSLHFKPTDYYFPDIECKSRRLKQNAVPSCNLESFAAISNYHRQLKQEREERVQKRDSQKEVEPALESIEANENNDENVQNSIENNSDYAVNDEQNMSDPSVQLSKNYQSDVLAAQDLLLKINHTKDKSNNFEDGQNLCESENVDRGVQADTFSLSDFIKSDSDLSTITGIESFGLLNVIVEIVRHNFGEKYEQDKCSLKTRERIILTYAKLKLNTTYAFLGIMFRISGQTCSRIFKEMVQILSKCLEFAIRWPSKHEISRNLPECFKDFKDTRVVLDCTEIFLQQPKNSCCQVITYSRYKSHLTGKIMTAVSAAGNIIYKSNFYGGRASDTKIFQESQLMKLLSPNDAIMVDKGFLIDEVCKKNKWKLIRPPFLKDKGQFTADEAALNVKIAAARVHVERSNQRIKAFEITKLMSSSLVPVINEIFTVICATVNLGAPIIGDKKFMKNKSQSSNEV